MKPLSQFEVQQWLPLQIFGVDISFSNSSFFMLLAAILPLVIIFFLLKKRDILPQLRQSFGEMFIFFIQNIMDDAAGPKGKPFLPFIAAVFFFVFMGNFLGLFPYAFTFTSQFIVNFALAFLVLSVVTITGFVLQGRHFLHIFLPRGVSPFVAPLLIPVEMISYMTKPLSLSIRLFANMVAGHSMVKIFAYFSIMLGVFGIFPLLVNVVLLGFELLVAFLQAYVFAMLSCIYLHDALEAH